MTRMKLLLNHNIQAHIQPRSHFGQSELGLMAANRENPSCGVEGRTCPQFCEVLKNETVDKFLLELKNPSRCFSSLGNKLATSRI